MTNEEARQRYLQRCRIGLCDHARASRRDGVTAAAWEELALVSEAGRAVGEAEVNAVMCLVWGIGGKALRWS